MSETSSSNNKPLVFAVCTTGVLFLLSGSIEIRWIGRRYLPMFVKWTSYYGAVIYGLITYRFYRDQGLIQTYSPQEQVAQFVGDYGGPLLSLIVELGLILTCLRLSRLLFEGITFNGWNHGLSGNDIWLLNGVAILFGVYALNILATRTHNVRNYWSDIAEVIPNHTPEPTESEE